MTANDAISPPLAVVFLATPAWIHNVQDIGSYFLMAGGAVLLVLQILYYWKQLHK